MAKEPEIVQVKVRMTTDLQRKLQRAAYAHGQTSNAEILARLIQSFEVAQLLTNATNRMKEVLDAMKGEEEGHERFKESLITALSQRTGASTDVIRGVIDEAEGITND